MSIARDPAGLFKANVGQDAAPTDIVKNGPPEAKGHRAEALFGYFIGREYAVDAQPEVACTYEAFKKGEAASRGHP